MRTCLRLRASRSPNGVALAAAALALALAPALGAQPGSPSAGAPGSSGTAPLEHRALGEVGGWILVTAQWSGEPGAAPTRWLLDTGSSTHVVTPALAQRLGLAARRSVTADVATGRIRAPEVVLPPLVVAGLERTGQVALVLDPALLVGAAADGLDGILGVPFFRGAEVELDLQAWQLRVGPVAPDCPPGWSAVALGRHRGLPVVPLEVPGGGPLRLLLDTGTAGGIVRALAEPPAGRVPGLPVDARQWLAVERVARVGASTRRDVPVQTLLSPELERALGAAVDGLAGVALLDGAVVRLALDAQRACLPAGDTAVPGGFGLTIELADGAVRVGQVLDGGPAAEAGLRRGDAVRSWQGLETAGRSPLDLWPAVRGRETLELLVGDPPRVVVLQRRIFAPPAR